MVGPKARICSGDRHPCAKPCRWRTSNALVTLSNNSVVSAGGKRALRKRSLQSFVGPVNHDVSELVVLMLPAAGAQGTHQVGMAQFSHQFPDRGLALGLFAADADESGYGVQAPVAQNPYAKLRGVPVGGQQHFQLITAG